MHLRDRWHQLTNLEAAVHAVLPLPPRFCKFQAGNAAARHVVQGVLEDVPVNKDRLSARCRKGFASLRGRCRLSAWQVTPGPMPLHHCRPRLAESRQSLSGREQPRCSVACRVRSHTGRVLPRSCLKSRRQGNGGTAAAGSAAWHSQTGQLIYATQHKLYHCSAP